MRFPADELHDIRRGEKTLVHLPHTGRACRFRSGHLYQLERVVDVPEQQPHKDCDGKGCDRCDAGQVTIYRRVSSSLAGEYVEIVAVPERRDTDAVSDADALREGYESADEWREVFECDHGDYAEVWRIEFAYAVDAPRLLSARPSSRAEDAAAKDDDLGYTSSHYGAMEGEPEAVDATTLERFSREATERQAGRKALQSEERKLSEWLAELEADPTTSAHQLASVRKRLEQIEKRRQRKAA